MVSYNDKNRPIQDSDISEFEIYFEAIFDYAPSFECFTKFLKETMNSESSEFLESVNEFRKVKHERKRMQMAINMYDKFIQDGANSQLNLRSDFKTKIHKVLFPVNNNNNQEEKGTPSTPGSPMVSGAIRILNSNLNQQTTSTQPTSAGSFPRHSLDSTNSTNSSSNESEDTQQGNSASTQQLVLQTCPKSLFDEVEGLGMFDFLFY